MYQRSNIITKLIPKVKLFYRNKSSRKLVDNSELISKCIEKTFGVGREETLKLLTNYPSLNKQNISQFQNLCSLLVLKSLCSKDILLNSGWILTRAKFELNMGIDILEKNSLIKHVIDGKTYILVVFLLPKNRFTYYCKRIINTGLDLFSSANYRIDYFCHQLDINEETFCSIIYNHIPLLTMDLDRIQTIMNLAKQCGISNEDILSDIWIFRHNIELMRKRIEESKRYNYPVKCWVLRSPDKVWYPLLNSWKEERSVLGGDWEKEEFLANKLSSDRGTIEGMTYKNPHLLTIKRKKIDDIITYLYSQGYTGEDIIRNPRILSHSIDRIKSRFNIKQELSIDKLPLHVIMKTDRQFNSYVFNITKRNSKVSISSS